MRKRTGARSQGRLTPDTALDAIALLARLLRNAARVPNYRRLPREGIDLEAHLEEIRKTLMAEALDRCGSPTKAAELLRMSFRSFRYYAKRHNLTAAAAGPQ
jgi:hypothetical protein